MYSACQTCEQSTGVEGLAPPSPNRHEWQEEEEPTPELVGVGSLEEQARQESNLQPPVLETGALPIELRT